VRMHETGRRTRRWLLPATAGVASVAFGAGVGELAAAVLAPASSPFVVVGAMLIDFAPPWAKDAAIALFGTADKAALLIGIGLVLLALAGAAGVLEVRRPPLGRVLIGVFGVVGAIAASTRANSSLLSAAPSAIAAIAGVLALQFLIPRLPAADSPDAATTDVAGTGTDDASAATTDGPAPSGIDRRRFLGWAGGAAALGALAALGGYALQAGARAVTAVREAITLPAPTATATVPTGAELGIDGLAPVITPNGEFYRIDTALAVPAVDPSGWSLRIHGMVDREVTITWDELLALPLAESITTLACVSNEVGGGLIGNAVWLGHPIRDLLARAGPSDDADMVLSRSVDGFTASTPLEVLTDERDAILAVGMNGEPLPAEHGFPVRMVVPGLYGYVSATKWVVDLEVTRFDEASAYWTDRGWSERGPVKLQSRIDVPRRGQSVSAGTVVVAGVAWYQHVGIEGVEVQVDDGEWRDATLATAISDDTWVQWRFDWNAPAGTHTVRVRATGADGEVQTAKRQGVVPDGATGLHEISVEVR
jgi:DMSO/TMAO reductase YedYZ molybdopterin-dependent catalytic subunit